MKVYIQSRGVSQEQDYRWLKIRENNQITEIPPILKRPIPGSRGTTVYITDMVDSQTPSLVLARSDGELLLLVTGLEARTERTDFMGRRVRNSVAWVAQDTSDNEKIVRSLAIRALKGELESEIDKAVNPGGEYGFEVALAAIKQLANPEELGISQPSEEALIVKNLPELRETLASDLELKEHCLPKRNGLLVVVTSIKNQDALQKAGVWRGLSNRVENEKWQPLLGAAPVSISNTSKPELSKQNVFFWRIAAVVMAAVTLLILFLLTNSPIPQTPQLKTNPSLSSPQTNLPVKKMT